MSIMTSVKTLSRVVSASSSCRLAYLKLEAFTKLEAFMNESVSLPCKTKLFRYAPAKLGF